MKKGLSFLEIVIVLFIFSILLIPTTFIVINYQKNLSLESAVSEIVEVLDYARNCAKSEREKFLVKFEDKNFYITKNGKIIDKVQHLPEHIYIKKITSGLNPVVFLPDGTVEIAGHIILGIENKNYEKRIIVNNITGKCIVK